MNIYELIEFLQDQPNKELDVLMLGATGWFSVCAEDSKEEDFGGDLFFVLSPCYGHGEPFEQEVRADDFKIDEN